MSDRHEQGPNPIMARLKEREYQAMIVDRAHARGWLVHHDRGDYRNCIAGDPGFPDLVLARDGVVLFFEVKTEKGKTTPAQDRWAKELLGRGQMVSTVRPSDWEVVCQLLDGGRT